MVKRFNDLDTDYIFLVTYSLIDVKNLYQENLQETRGSIMPLLAKTNGDAVTNLLLRKGSEEKESEGKIWKNRIDSSKIQEI